MRVKPFLLIGAAFSLVAGCNSQDVSAPPAGYSNAAATRTCGPADGPAVAIYLAPDAIDTLEPAAPYIRIYLWKSVDAVLGFVEEFAELGSYLDMPIRTYSAGMNARLAFAASLAVDFDCYLVDEITAAGDERFRARCHAALMERRERGTLVMVSHDPHTLRAYCTSGATLSDGRLTFYDSIEGALEQHF